MMNFPRITILFINTIALFPSGNVQSQTFGNLRHITITTDDSIIKANVSDKPFTEKIAPNCTYYWYYSGIVNHNVGGYSGKLLHDKYQVFDNQQRLRVSGNFQYGVMNGMWVRWYPTVTFR